MKNKLSSIILITVFILGIGVYFIFSFNRGAINSKTKITDNKNIKSVNSLTNKDFVIKNKSNYIELGRKYEDLKTNEKITKIISANVKVAYDIYVFKDFNITVTLSIDSIELTTPIMETSRGIRIGDTMSEVFKKYGNTKEYSITNANRCYEYQYKGKLLIFYANKIGKINDIKLEYI